MRAMPFRKSILILFVFCIGCASAVQAGDYLETLKSRASQGDREAQETLAHLYEKTGRKGLSKRTMRGDHGRVVAFEKRLEPTRPDQRAVNREIYQTARSEVDARGGRYEPQRPQGDQGRDVYSESRSRQNDWESLRRDYDRIESSRQKYDRIASYDRNYNEVKERRKKGSLGKKILLSPFKFGFKVSKKAVKKLSLGWLPLL